METKKLYRINQAGKNLAMDSAWQANLELQRRLAPEQELKDKTYIQFALSQNGHLWLLFDGDTVLARAVTRPMPTAGQLSLGFILRDHLHPEALNALLKAIIKSASTEGFKQVLAPLNINTWLAYRLRVDEEALQFEWEPPRDPELYRLLSDLNFLPITAYHTQATRGASLLAEHCQPSLSKALKEGFHFQSLANLTLSPEDKHALYQISDRAFASNPYFESIPEPLFQNFYIQNFTSIPLDFSFIVRSHEGQLVGYMIAFLDKSGKYLVLKTMAIDPDYASRGLGRALCGLSVKTAAERSIEDFISALMLRGNRSEFTCRYGEVLWSHHYELLALTLNQRQNS
ncbi:MAG: GNAT family N-acetyltransferase [Proteobacteria bacterium]|nr:GNAT family N-acetyltransferase [Pseudomonadota bacterium]